MQARSRATVSVDRHTDGGRLVGVWFLWPAALVMLIEEITIVAEAELHQPYNENRTDKRCERPRSDPPLGKA